MHTTQLPSLQANLTLQTDLISSKDELHESGISIDDVLNILLRGGVEVGRVTKLQGEAVSLTELVILVTFGKRPVVTSAAGRVKLARYQQIGLDRWKDCAKCLSNGVLLTPTAC